MGTREAQQLRGGVGDTRSPASLPRGRRKMRVRPLPPGSPLWPIFLRGHFQRPSAAPPPLAALPKPEGPRPSRAALTRSRPYPERPWWARSPDVPSSRLRFLLRPGAAGVGVPTDLGTRRVPGERCRDWDAASQGLTPATPSVPQEPRGVRLSFRGAPAGVAAASRSPGPDACPWRPRAAERRERAGELGVHPQGHGGLGAHPSDRRREEESGARSYQKGSGKGS